MEGEVIRGRLIHPGKASLTCPHDVLFSGHN